MKIAAGSDEKSRLTDALVEELEKRGHEVVAFGPVAGEKESDWPLVCGRVAEAVAAGEAEEGIVCCWTGTGASIAANKVPGIRAALAHDAQTAQERASGTTPTCSPSASAPPRSRSCERYWTPGSRPPSPKAKPKTPGTASK